MAHILAIDDDQAMLVLIKNTLKKDGHEVTCMEQITETLKNKLSFYDLILLDVMMPGTDGYTFCRKARSYTDCPILFLTATTTIKRIIFDRTSTRYPQIFCDSLISAMLLKRVTFNQSVK